MTGENKWDVVLKSFGVLGLIAGAVIGLFQYYSNSQQTSALETSKLDSDQHKLYFDKQLQYYLDVTELVASIATTHDKPKRENLRQRFDALYYGPMVILEDRGESPDAVKHQPGEKHTNDANVERHMVAVHDCLLRNCSDGELEQESLALADTCRFALSLNWASRVQNLRQGLDFRQRLGIKPDTDK